MRRFLIPEVVQTSAMDCGPAALKSLLEGFGVPASYGRLREACFTGVDGTSIDHIEEAAISLGLQAEQIMLPIDHLLLEEAAALPALVVVRLAGGVTHFVVAWRRCGNWIQVMDPGVGRQWRACSDFLSQVYIHAHEATAADWREWAGSPDFQKPLQARLRKLGVNNDLLNQALADETPVKLSALDAATRLVESLAAEGALQRGSALAGLLASLVQRPESIPAAWWSARPDPASGGQIQLRGAVLMRVTGLRPAAEVDRAALTPEFADALNEQSPGPLTELWKTWREAGLRAPLALTAALILAAAGVAAEALLFRAMFDIGSVLMLGTQRWWALGAFAVFLAIVTRIELSISGATLQGARKFEGSLRLKFLSKIPRLPDAYFRSRLMSDMAERSHSAHLLRQLPALVIALARAILGLAFTVAGIAWLYPQSFIPALVAAVVAVAAPLLAQPWLAERDLRARNHAGALNTYFLDALLGLTALRANGAGRAIMRQQESLLGEWAAAAMRFGSAAVAIQGVQSLLCLVMVTWLLFARLTQGDEVGGLLLLIYWALNIPALGQEVAALVCQYPRVRNTFLRFTEPLGAREDEPTIDAPIAVNQTVGVSIDVHAVSVQAAGLSILEDVTISLAPGEHVAVVGTSGAGKSTLAGLLLGWNRPSSGTLQADGETLDAAGVARLRQSTVWISPQTHLWNRSLYDNLQYGNDIGSGAALDEVLDEAELTGVIEKMPEGMQTPLGESGRLLSGGEGQRVRFGRGLRRADVRLAILDEAFRGLERDRRRTLLDTARKRWKEATLLNITHDLGETWSFPRVLVVDKGRIVEDGSPQELYRRPDSRYRALVDAEESVQSSVWSDRKWRTLAMQNGRLEEKITAKAAIRHKEIA